MRMKRAAPNLIFSTTLDETVKKRKVSSVQVESLIHQVVTQISHNSAHHNKLRIYQLIVFNSADNKTRCTTDPERSPQCYICFDFILELEFNFAFFH
jgi:hypothetical protein